MSLTTVTQEKSENDKKVRENKVLEDFKELLDNEQFDDAKILAKQYLGDEGYYNLFKRPLFNYYGGELIRKYKMVNYEKAKRIADAFSEWKWTLFL